MAVTIGPSGAIRAHVAIPRVQFRATERAADAPGPAPASAGGGGRDERQKVRLKEAPAELERHVEGDVTRDTGLIGAHSSLEEVRHFLNVL